MNSPTLTWLKMNYSSALYSFFRVTNLGSSLSDFLKDPERPPSFTYMKRVSLLTANRRLVSLRKLAKSDGLSQTQRTFIEHRIKETLILRKFLRMRQQPQAITPGAVEKYLKMQEELYGAMDPELFAAIMQRLKHIARRRGPTYLVALREIEDRLVEVPRREDLYVPGDEIFLHYKRLFDQSFLELHRVLSAIRKAENYSTEEIVSILRHALTAVGATKFGWKVLVSVGGAHMSVAKQRRIIIVGTHYRPNSTQGLKQVVVHEVGGHVQKAMVEPIDHLIFTQSDEGLAIILEQLLEPRFKYKRTLRYLAVSLAIGLDGKKRDFCEVYDILRLATYIVTGKHNREIAFFETARVFRGGLPEVPGLVYIKDKIYLEENLAVWRELEQNKLNLDEFRKLFLEGDRLKKGRVL